MRLIGCFSKWEQGKLFSDFLSTQNIKNSCCTVQDKGGLCHCELWVDLEEDVCFALHCFEEYNKDPFHPKFMVPRSRIEEKKTVFPFVSITSLCIILCSLFFLVNEKQMRHAEKGEGILWTPLFSVTLFDYPKGMEELQEVLAAHHLSMEEDLQTKSPEIQREIQAALALPVWGGVIKTFMSKEKSPPPLFEKISTGEVWRLFSPCLIHRDFWHLFFNMSWLWGFGLQIERKLKASYLIVLIFLLGIFSNLIQYLVSGPYFLGFSGVIVGLGAFIWSRQKKAPWEGYHVQKGVFFFLCLGVLGMCLVGAVSFLLQLMGFSFFSIPIANSAHISGGILGWALGKTNLFTRRVS